MTAQPPRRRRTVLMTAGLTASAAVIAFTVAGPGPDDGLGPGESSQAQPYDDPEPPEAA